MRTTFELPDQLLRQAKALAALQGISLKELLTQAVAEKLDRLSSLKEDKPWMELYGKGQDYAGDLKRMEDFIAAEFETFNDKDWK